MGRTGRTSAMLATLWGWVLTAAVLPAWGASEDRTGVLADCRTIEAADERLACYDQLAQRDAAKAQADGPPAGSAARAEEDDGVAPLTDDVAKPGSSGDDGGRREYGANVVRCEVSDLEQRAVFYMENGQVWRQTNAGREANRYRNEDCDFEVTLRRDVFGWKLRPVGEKRSLRVTRIR